MSSTATEPTGWYWLGTAGLALVFASLSGYLVLQFWRRYRIRRRAAQVHHAALPAEYLFRREPLRSRLVLYALVVVAAVPAGLMFGKLGAALAVLIVVMPWLPAIFRRRAAHVDEIITTVEARAPAMDDDELRSLVRGLELEHGEAEMKPLRQLLQTRQVRAPADQ